jgi:uncharacterized membrane protein
MPQSSQFQKIKEIESKINKNLFIVCAIITVIVMTTILIEFFTRGAFPPSGMNIFYIGILFIYSVHKEMIRWVGEKHIERQGEWFVYIWIGLTSILYLINFLTKGYFSYSTEGMPVESLREASTITLEVSTIFLLTRASKTIKIFLEEKK